MDIQSALKQFEESADQHGIATEVSDYKSANKNFKRILFSVNFLKRENRIDYLLAFLNHSSLGVQLWAATYLLPFYEKESIQTLETIQKRHDIHSLTAKTVLSEWKKGNLKV